MNTELTTRIKEFAQEVSGEVNIPLHTSREVWLSMFHSAPEFAQILMKKIWFLLRVDKRFYTSDTLLFYKIQ